MPVCWVVLQEALGAGRRAELVDVVVGEFKVLLGGVSASGRESPAAQLRQVVQVELLGWRSAGLAGALDLIYALVQEGAA